MADISQVTIEGVTYDVKDEIARNRTIDYNNVTNKPMINGVILEGDKALTDFGVVPVGDLTQFQNADGTLKAEVIEGFINGAMAQLKTQYDIAEHSDKIAILFENLDSTSPTYGAMAIGTQGLMISKTRENDEWVWTTALTSNGLITDIIAVHSIGANKLDGSITNGNWVLDFTDGTFTIGEIAANKITAGQITAAITATNLTMTGGTIQMSTNQSDFSFIDLAYGTGEVSVYGNSIHVRSTNGGDHTHLFNDGLEVASADQSLQAHVSSNAINVYEKISASASKTAVLGSTTLSFNNEDTTKTTGIYLTESTGSYFPALYYNGTNLWIGASKRDTVHFEGGTYISAGYSGNTPNKTIHVAVPNANNTSATSYDVWHSGNALQSVQAQTALGTTTQTQTETWLVQGSVTFDPGTYLILVDGYFAANATGRRVMLFNTVSTAQSTENPIDGSVIDSRAAVNGVATRLKFSTIKTFSSSTTWYLKAYQNSGSPLNFTSSYSYLRIK